MTSSDASPTTGSSPAQLRRLGGAALVLALPLQVAGFLIHPPTEELVHVVASTYATAHLLLFASWLLVMLGLPALYAAQADRAGRLGLVAYVATMAAVAYHLYLTLYESAAIPVAAADPASAALIGADGPLAHGAGARGFLAPPLLLAFPLFGIATLRARVLPRLAGWLPIASVATFLVLMLGIGLVTGGAVGPDANGWIGGMLPIASLYWVLFGGFAVGGRLLWLQGRHAAPARSSAEIAPATP